MLLANAIMFLEKETEILVVCSCSAGVGLDFMLLQAPFPGLSELQWLRTGLSVLYGIMHCQVKLTKTRHLLV